jgi:hypothetical protein
MKRLVLFFGAFFIIHNLGYSLEMSEILGRPENTSMSISVLFDQYQEVYWEFGTVSCNYSNTSSVYIAAKDTPVVFKFDGLTANTKYYYRTCYRTKGATTAFLTSAEHTFQTQRVTGSTFTFNIEADEHLYDKKGVRSIYQICLANQAKDNPDFMFTLGDIFGDDHYPYTITSANLDDLHKDYRQYLGQICHSIPFLICLGNHEGEKDYYLHLTPPYNMAVYATLWRKFYYSNPYPDSFYSGNSDVEDYGMGMPENYYSFTWGDALFVVMDVYRYDCDTSAKPKNWNWTLGQVQYNWLKSTLENNTSKYKFVFAHHVSGEGRGGIEQAKLFEWGGYEANGTTWGFSSKRPNMEKPIHQLFVDNGVNIFFQGHDHLFAHEVMDGVVYQEVPMPSDSTYEIGTLANADAYVSDTIVGTGHVRVTVSPENVKVDFVRAYLPADTVSGAHKNREIAFSYTLSSSTTSVCKTIQVDREVSVFPNPAKGSAFLKIGNCSDQNVDVRVYNLDGILVSHANLDNYSTYDKISLGWLNSGIYMVSVNINNTQVITKKLIIE